MKSKLVLILLVAGYIFWCVDAHATLPILDLEQSGYNITVSWEPYADDNPDCPLGFQRYELYRQVGGTGGYTCVYQSATSCTYVDTDTLAHQQYEYYVKVITLLELIPSNSNNETTTTAQAVVSLEVPSQVTEGNILPFKAKLNRQTHDSISIGIRTLDGTAVKVNDYAETNTTFTIPANTSEITINLRTINDSTYEPNENFTVNIFSTTSNATYDTQHASYSTTIVDDQAPPQMSITSISAKSEDSADFSVEVTLNYPSAGQITGNIYSSSSIAEYGSNRDYTVNSTSVVFSPGSTSQNVTVHLVNDDFAEPNETVTFDLANVSGASIGTGTRDLSIIDDDVAPVVSFTAGDNFGWSQLNYNVETPTDLLRRIKIYRTDAWRQVADRQLALVYDNAVTKTTGSIVDRAYFQLSPLNPPTNPVVSQPINTKTAKNSVSIGWTKSADQTTTHMYTMEAIQRRTSTDTDGLMSDCLSKDRTFETMQTVSCDVPARLNYIDGFSMGVSIVADCNITTAPGYKSMEVYNMFTSTPVRITYPLQGDEFTTGCQDFIVSAWHKNNGTAGQLTLQYTDDGTNWNDAGTTFGLSATAGGNQWHQIQFYAHVPSTVCTGLRLLMTSNAEYSYWDELSLKKMTIVTQPRPIDRYDIILSSDQITTAPGSVTHATSTCAGDVPSTHTFQNLNDGTYWAHVRAIDTFGNYSQWTTIGPWQIEHTPPIAPVLTNVEDPEANPNYIIGDFNVSGRYSGPLADISIGIYAENIETHQIQQLVTFSPTSADFARSVSITGSEGRYRIFATATKNVAPQENTVSDRSNAIDRNFDPNSPEFGGVQSAVPVFSEGSIENVTARLVWLAATDTGSGVDHYDVYTSTTQPVLLATVADDGSTSYSTMYNGQLRSSAVTAFNVVAYDAAGTSATTSFSKRIYGVPRFIADWHVVQDVWSTSLTLAFNAGSAEGRRMHIWGGDFFKTPDLTHEWVDFQTPVMPINLKATLHSAKRLYAQAVDGQGNYTVPVRCDAIFNEPEVLDRLDLVRSEGGTSVSLQAAADYASGETVIAYLIGYDQYGANYPIAGDLANLQHTVTSETNSITVERNGGTFVIHCGKTGAGALTVSHRITGVKTDKVFRVPNHGPLSRIEVIGKNLIKTGQFATFKANGYDESDNQFAISPKWSAGQLGYITTSGTLSACVTDSIVTGTIQAQSQEITGQLAVEVDGKAPVVLNVSLSPGPDGDVEISTQTQQVRIVTDHLENALPAKFDVYLDDKFLGTVPQTDNTSTTYTTATLIFDADKLRMGTHKLSVISADNLDNSSAGSPYVKYFRTPYGNPPASAIDWLLVNQNLADGTDYGTWLEMGRDRSYDLGGDVYQPADTMAATAQEVAEALLTLKEYDPDYVSRDKNYSIGERTSVRDAIGGGLNYLAGLIADPRVQDPLTRMRAAEAVLELRDRSPIILLNDSSTSEPVHVDWNDVVSSATAIMEQSLVRNDDGGVGAFGLNGSSHMATMMAMRLTLSGTTTTLNATETMSPLTMDEIDRQIADWKRYLKFHYECIENHDNQGETGRWALNQWDWWNQARITLHSAEILRTMDMLTERAGSSAETDLIIAGARTFLMDRSTTITDIGIGFGDPSTQDSNEVTTVSVVSTATALWALKQADLIETPTLTAGVAYLNHVMKPDHSWNDRALDTALALRLMKPDLLIESIGTPTMNAYGYIDYPVTLRNIGVRPAYAFDVTVHSCDPRRDSIEQRDASNIGRSINAIGKLDSNGRITVTVTTFESAPVMYFMVDSRDGVKELAEDNNILSRKPDPRADLVILPSDIRFGHVVNNVFTEADILYVDESWDVAITIRNRGVASVNASDSARFKLYFGEQKFEVTAHPINDLTPNSSDTYLIPISQSTGYLTSGDYPVSVQIESGSVNETDTNNNYAASKVSLFDKANQHPDLVINRITTNPVQPQAGEPFKLLVDVLNQGQGIAKDLKLQLRIDGTNPRDLPEEDQTIPLLFKNQEAHFEFDMILTAPGAMFTAIADPYEKIVEFDENNNAKELWVSIPLDGHDLAVAPYEACASAKKNDGKWDLVVDVHNLGKSSFSPDPNNAPLLMATRKINGVWYRMPGVDPVALDTSMASNAVRQFTWTDFPFNLDGKATEIRLELVNNHDGAPVNDVKDVEITIQPNDVNLFMDDLRAVPKSARLASGEAKALFDINYRFRKVSPDAQKNVLLELRDTQSGQLLWGMNIEQLDAATTVVAGTINDVELYPPQALLSFKVDASNDITETNENDNTSQTTVAIFKDHVTPDLAYKSEEVRVTTLENGTKPRYMIEVDVENKSVVEGQVPDPSGAFAVAAFKADNTTIGLTRVEDIKGSMSRKVALLLDESVSSGTITVKLDKRNEVVESDENNNTMSFYLACVPEPENVAARSILQDGRIEWMNNSNIGQDGYIDESELSGYRISRAPAWERNLLAWVPKSEISNGKFVFFDLQLDAATSYTYQIVTVATNGVESTPVSKSLRTTSVPVITGFIEGKAVASGSAIQAGTVSQNNSITLKIAAPQADKITLYKDGLQQGVDYPVVDGVATVTTTLHYGRQSFIAQPVAIYNEGGVEKTVRGVASAEYSVTYRVGVDLAVSSYQIVAQYWDTDLKWKTIPLSEINQLGDARKFRVRAIVHNNESLPCAPFHVEFKWATNLRNLNGNPTVTTRKIAVGGLGGCEATTVTSANAGTDTEGVFLKPAGEVVQYIGVTADIDHEIAETLEYNNYAETMGAQFDCQKSYDILFLLDTSHQNTQTDLDAAKEEIRKWTVDLNDRHHRIALITFNENSATIQTDPCWKLPSGFNIDAFTINRSTSGTRDLKKAFESAKTAFTTASDDRKLTATPVVVLLDGGNGSNYNRLDQPTTNTTINSGNEVNDLVAAIREANKLKRENELTPIYNKALDIYQIRFTQSASDKYAIGSWLWSEEAMFLRHLNSTLGVDMTYEGTNFEVRHNAAQDGVNVTNEDQPYKLKADLYGQKNFINQTPLEYERYWLEGFNQIVPDGSVRNIANTQKLGTLRGVGDEVWRIILLWPQGEPLPNWLRNQDIGPWVTEGRFGFRRWMLNYSLTDNNNVTRRYDMLIGEGRPWCPIDLYGGKNNGEPLQYTAFTHSDEHVKSLWSMVQDYPIDPHSGWPCAHKMIDDHVILANPLYDHNAHGFKFYYPDICPLPMGKDLAVYFYKSNPAQAAEPGVKGFPGGLPRPHQTGDLVAVVKNEGDQLIESATIVFSTGHSEQIQDIAPGQTKVVKQEDYYNDGSATIQLTVSINPVVQGDVNQANNSDTLEVQNSRSNLKWGGQIRVIYNNTETTHTPNDLTIPVRWQVDKKVSIGHEYVCEDYIEPVIEISDNDVISTHTVSLGSMIYRCEETIPTTSTTQPALRNLVLDPAGKIVESLENDNSKAFQLAYDYLFQDARVSSLDCTGRDADGTIHLTATIERICVPDENFTFDKAGIYLFRGTWTEDHSTKVAIVSTTTAIFDELSSGATRQVSFTMKADPMSSITLSVVADPYMTELHENPNGGHANNFQVITIPPTFVNLMPKSFVMKVDGSTTDTIQRGAVGMLELVSNYGWGDDIPTSVSYKVRFWKDHPSRIAGTPIADQIVRDHLRATPDKLIQQILETSNLDGDLILFAEIDPRDHVAAAVDDTPSTVPLYQSRPWALNPIDPQLTSAAASGAWYIDMAVANSADSAEYSTVAQWRSDQTFQTTLPAVSAAGPILLRLRSDAGLPNFKEGDTIHLNFGQLNTAMLYQPDDESGTSPTLNGWSSAGSGAWPKMNYLTTDVEHTKMLHLTTQTSGTVVGNFALPINQSGRPCVSMWYNNRNTSEPLTIEFEVETTTQVLTMSFVTSDTVAVNSDTQLNYALGSFSRATNWKNLYVDLNMYLRAARPNASVLSIESLRIKSNNVYIDEILLGEELSDFYTVSTETSSVEVKLPANTGSWNSMALWIAADGSTYFANSMHMASDPNGGEAEQAWVNMPAATAMIDDHGLIAEADEDDNIAAIIVHVVKSGFDMEVSEISTPKNVYLPGEIIPLSVEIRNILAPHNREASLEIYANDQLVATQPVSSGGGWDTNMSRSFGIDIANVDLAGPVVTIRADLINNDDVLANNTKATSITLSNTVSLSITAPQPNQIARGEAVSFHVQPYSTPAITGDVSLWIIPSDVENETHAVGVVTGLSNCEITTATIYARSWTAGTSVAPGSYKVYGQLKIGGNVAASASSEPFTIIRNPMLAVNVSTDKTAYEEGKPVQFVYSVRNPSASTPVEHRTTVTLSVQSRNYWTTCTTGVDRIEILQPPVIFDRIINNLPCGEYDAVVTARCAEENLSAVAAASFIVGTVGELPLERLTIGNAASSNPLYTNSMATTLTLHSVGQHAMDSSDFMWLHDAQPLQIENHLHNGDMSIPDGAGASGWSGGARVVAGAGWGLQLDEDTSSVMTAQPFRVLPLKEYCLSFTADELTSDISITVSEYSIGGYPTGNSVGLNSVGRGVWDGTSYRYEIPLRTSNGAHELGLKLAWGGAGSIVLDNLQFNPGTVAAPYRDRVIGSRANLFENQSPVIDSGVDLSRIQPLLASGMDGVADNGISDGWRFDGDGTVTLVVDSSLPIALNKLGIRSSATLTANANGTPTLSQRMIPVRPAEQTMLSLQGKGSGRISIIGYDASGVTQLYRSNITIDTSEWTTTTSSVDVPASPAVHSLAVEIMTTQSLSVAALMLVDGGRSAEPWSGWISYAPTMARDLAAGADGLRSVYARYLTDAGAISMHGLEALTRDADGNAYPDAVSGSTLTGTTTSLAAVVDGNATTALSLDSVTSFGLTLSMPDVHYVECLRLASDLASTATLAIEGSLDGSIWLPAVSTSVSPGARDLLVPVCLGMSSWRIRLTAFGGVSGDIHEIELRGLTSAEGDTVIVDRVSPTASVHLTTPARTKTQTASFAGSAEDELSGIGRIEYRMLSPDGTTSGPISAADIPSLNVDYTLSLPVTAEGTHYLFVRSIDQAANVSADASTSVTIDTTGPAIASIEPTSGSLFNAPATVAWTVQAADVAATYGIDSLRPFRVVEVTTSSISSGQQAVAEGHHTVTAWAVDDLSNVGPTTATSFVIDMTSPTISLDPTIAGPKTNHLNLEYHGSAADGVDETGLAVVEISVDALTWSNIAFDPVTGDYATTVTVAGSGSHTIRARSIDRAGNVSLIAAHSIEVDLDAPVMHIDSPTTGTWSNTSLELLWHTDATDLASSHGLIAWRQLNGTTTATLNVMCGDEVTSEGRYLLQVYGTDTAGNDGPTTVTAFAIDKTSPSVTLLPMFSSPTREYALPYHGTALDGLNESGLASVQIRVDEGQWASVSFDSATGDYTTTVTVETEGTHHVYARSFDAVGNVSPVAAHTFDVDWTPPVMRITEPTTGTWHNNDTLMIWNTADADLATSHGTLTWRSLDASTTAVMTVACGDHATSEGTYLLAVRGTDTAGNDGPTTMTAFAIDKTSPTITLVAINPDPTKLMALSYMGTAGDGAGQSGLAAVQINVDSSPDWTAVEFNQATGEYSAVVNVTSEGLHEIRARAIDVAGNVSVTATDSITVDQTPPVMQIDTPTSGTWANEPVTMLWSTQATDLDTSQGLLIWHSLDAGTSASLMVSCGDEATSEGRYALYVHGIDRANNEGPLAETVFGIDATSPTITLNSLADTSSTLVTCSGGVSDAYGCGVRTVYYRLDLTGDWYQATSLVSDPTPESPTHALYQFSVTLASGWHTIETRALDKAGNYSAIAQRMVMVDPIAPQVTINQPQANAVLSGTFQIQAGATDNLAGVGIVQFRFNQFDELWSPLDRISGTALDGIYQGSLDSWSLVEGTSVTLMVRARDVLGNQCDPVERTVSVDNDYPPQAPTGLFATYRSYTQLELSWNKNTEADLKHYKIFRRVNDSNPINDPNDLRADNVTDTSGTVLNYYYDEVTTQTATTNYWKLGMKAVDEAGNISSFSDTVTVAPPDTPANVNAVGSDTLVTLTWDAVSEGFVKGYNIYRNSGATPTTGTLYRTIIGRSNTITTDTNVVNGTTYWYYVVAFDGAYNKSQRSKQVSATPSPTPTHEDYALVRFEDGARRQAVDWDFNDVGAIIRGKFILTNGGKVSQVIIKATLEYHDSSQDYNMYTAIANVVGGASYSGTVWKTDAKRSQDVVRTIPSHAYAWKHSDLLTGNIPLFEAIGNGGGDKHGYYAEITLTVDNPSSNPLTTFDVVPFDTWITVPGRGFNYTYHIFDPYDPDGLYYYDAIQVTDDAALEGVYLNSGLVIKDLNWTQPYNGKKLWLVYPDFVGYARTYRNRNNIENTSWYLNGPYNPN